MKEFKGRYWAYLVILFGVIINIPSLLDSIHPQVKENVIILLGLGFAGIVAFMIVSSAFVVGESYRRIYATSAWGKAFTSKDDSFIVIFRFSILHLIVFILNNITFVPINKGLKWCDKYLTIQIKNERVQRK